MKTAIINISFLILMVGIIQNVNGADIFVFSTQDLMRVNFSDTTSDSSIENSVYTTFSKIAKIDSLPDLTMNSSAVLSVVDGVTFYKVCSNTLAELTFTNTSSTIANNVSYTIDWGDGSSIFTANAWSSLNHLYSIGLWKLTYTIVSKFGFTNSKTINIYVGSNPAVSLGSPGNTDNCSNTPLTFPITGTENNPPGTTYTVSFNDGTASQVFNHPPPASITHEFASTSCGVTSYNGTSPYPNSFSASIVASNMCGVSAVNVVPIYVSTAPVVDFDLPSKPIAINNSICFTNSTTGYVNEGANCLVVPKMVWSISPSTGFSLISGVLGSDFNQDNSNLWVRGTDVICPVFTVPGVYTISLRVDTKRCGNDQIVKTICVEAPIIPEFYLDNKIGCSPLEVSATDKTDLTNTCNSAYSWTVAYVAGYGGKLPAQWSFNTGTTKTSKNPSFKFVTPGTYKLRLSVTNSAGTKYTEQTIVVTQPPIVSIDSIPDFCGTASIHPVAAVNTCTPLTEHISYSWSFPGGSPESSTSLNPGIITYNAVGKYEVTLTVSNECGATLSTSNIFSVNQIPYVNIIEDKLINNGQVLDKIVFEGLDNSTYLWVNDNPSIGLADSGEGDIELFTAINNTNTVQIATISIRPIAALTGCEGVSMSFKISVNPSGDLNQPENIIVSNNETTTEIVFTTDKIGGETDYSWKNNNSSIGLGLSGEGSIKPFKAINNTNEPIIDTVSVTPYFKNGGKISDGVTKSFSITVLPTAQVNPIENIEVCNGIHLSEINFSTNRTTGTTSYKWTNDNPAIGIGFEGEGDIENLIVKNTNSVSIMATISVIPTYEFEGVKNVGEPIQFTIKVNPGPVIISQPVSSYVCPGGKIEPLKIEYEAGAGTPVYQWYWTKIKLNSGGIIIPNATSDTYNPPTNAPGTIYYYCTISLPSGICSSVTSEVATVSINDGAIIQNQPTKLQNICLGGTINKPLNFSFTGGSGIATYQWFYSENNSIQAAKLIPAAIDSVYTPPVFTQPGDYYYFAELTMTGDGCGTVQTDLANVHVVSDPLINKQPIDSQIICQGTAAKALTLNVSGGLGTYKYQWYVNSVDDNTSGSVIVGANSVSYLPSSELTGTAFYYCEVTQPNGLNCAVTSETSIVTVNPIPVFTQQPVSATICFGNVPNLLSVGYQYGVGNPQYQWYINAVNSNTKGSTIQGATQNTYLPVSSTVGTSYYYCVISFSTGGFSKIISNVAALTILPVPAISSKQIIICNDEIFSVIPDNSKGDVVPEGVVYKWSEPVITPAGSINGTTAQTTPVSEITQRLFNKTNSPATAVYTISAISGSCIGESFEVSVLVVPTIKVNEKIINVSCFGVGNGSIHLSITGGLPFESLNSYTISWTGPNGFKSNSKDIENLIAGEYIVAISDSSDCSSVFTYNISEPTAIEIIADEVQQLSCFDSSNGHIFVSVKGGIPPYSYNWTKDGDSFASTEDIDNLSSGNYILTVSDSKSCNVKSLNFNIPKPEKLTIDLGKQENIKCNGDNSGAISVTISGGTPFKNYDESTYYIYSWQGPNGFTSVSKDLLNLNAGIYQLTVTDKNSCTAFKQIELTESPELIVDVEISPVTCFKANDASIKLNISGGTAPYSIQWNNFGKSEIQKNLAPGEYIAIVTDANNCQKTVVAVIPDTDFSIDPIVKNVSSYGAHDGSITLNVNGGINPINLTWDDDPNAGSQRNNLGPGTYTLMLMDGAPCHITETFVITEPQQMQITSKIKNALACDNLNSGAIDLFVIGGLAPYSYKWSTGCETEDLSDVPAGIYLVTVTDAIGSSKKYKFEIIRQMPLELSVESKIVIDFDTKNYKLMNTAHVSGGFAPYQIQWDNGKPFGQRNESMEINKNTVVSLTVTDSVGCAATLSFNAIVPSLGIVYSLVECNKFLYQFSAFETNDQIFNYTYLWDFGDGETSTTINPQHNYKTSGIFKVTLTVKGEAGECVIEKTLDVNILTKLTLDREPKYCQGDSTIVYVNGAHTYKWNTGATGDSIILSKPENYSVIGTTLEGCKDTMYFSASSYDVLGFSIYTENDEIILDGTETHIWSDNIPYTQYFWDLGDGSVAEGNNIYHVYNINKEGYFDVKLMVINPNGCTEKATKRMWISIPELPNTFSPNGDGINDYFLQNWDVKVYNRNGAVLYEGKDGWDGNHNGKQVTNDIYFYVVYYQTPSGTKTKPGYVRIIR
ncbi:MAG: PKD domain-containing protein [Paludibacter sp.]|nr:PKD domain-containing protein [Paludibacter sp.]